MLKPRKLLAGLIYLTTLAPNLVRGATVTAIGSEEGASPGEGKCPI